MGSAMDSYKPWKKHLEVKAPNATMKLYLAGAISNCTYQEATQWRHQIKQSLDPKAWVVLDPMGGKSHLDNGERIAVSYDHKELLCSDRAIITRDRHMVKQADIVLFNLTYGANKLIGTSVELGWANAWDKTCIAAIPEDSQYQHPFIRELCHCLPSLDEALRVLKSYEV